MAWLVPSFITLGVLAIVIAVVGITRVDEHLWARTLFCCRCRREWHGREKFCTCGGKGRTQPPPEHRWPDHDWQGWMDTQPMAAVRFRNFDFGESRLGRGD